MGVQDDDYGQKMTSKGRAGRFCVFEFFLFLYTLYSPVNKPRNVEKCRNSTDLSGVYCNVFLGP